MAFFVYQYTIHPHHVVPGRDIFHGLGFRFREVVANRFHHEPFVVFGRDVAIFVGFRDLCGVTALRVGKGSLQYFHGTMIFLSRIGSIRSLHHLYTLLRCQL